VQGHRAPRPARPAGLSGAAAASSLGQLRSSSGCCRCPCPLALLPHPREQLQTWHSGNNIPHLLSQETLLSDKRLEAACQKGTECFTRVTQPDPARTEHPHPHERCCMEPSPACSQYRRATSRPQTASELPSHAHCGNLTYEGLHGGSGVARSRVLAGTISTATALTWQLPITSKMGGRCRPLLQHIGKIWFLQSPSEEEAGAK